MDPVRWRSHRTRNFLQSALLLGAMVGLLGLLGWLLAGKLGVVLAAFGALAIGALSPAVAPGLALQLAGARELPVHTAPQLYETVRTLAERAGLERMPALHYVPSNAVNAFAVGDSRLAAIALSAGLLRVLSRRELTGVLAHELSHLRSGDTWLLGLAALFGRITGTLSILGQLLFLLNVPLILLGSASFSWTAILVLIFAPTLSALLQLALSRTREFDADLGAVALTGDPRGLANALEKLARIEQGWLARMLRLGRPTEPDFLRTHPATTDRVRRLRELEVTMPMATPGWTSRGDHGGPLYRRAADPDHDRLRRGRSIGTM